jgi:lipoic acid synthetase
LVRYIRPEEFEEHRLAGERLGFISVVSSPLVRSSFHAAKMYVSAIRESKQRRSRSG